MTFSAELASIIRPYLPAGEPITPQAVTTAVLAAQASFDLFLDRMLRDSTARRALVETLSGTWDEFRTEAGMATE